MKRIFESVMAFKDSLMKISPDTGVGVSPLGHY